jgi:3-hydroxybutyrate dehydrogenase
MTQPLNGRNALITGSTSGIGLGIASALAESGVGVMLNGFGEADDIERMRDTLADRTGSRVGYHPADLSKPDQIIDLIRETKEFLGSIDILVNNAGIQFVSPLESFPPETWDRIIAINLSAAFHTIRLVIADMKVSGWGRIINMASSHGLVSSPFKSAYAAAKHGVVGLTKTAALEAAESGVTVNAICPGYVLTPLVENQIPDLAQSRGISEEEVKRDVMLQSQPTRRFVTVSEVADLVTFLCSDSAISITGSALTIDGGCTAQ